MPTNDDLTHFRQVALPIVAQCAGEDPSVSRAIVPELSHMVEICLTGELPLFHLSVLLKSMTTLKSKPDANVATYLLSTQVILDPSEHPDVNLANSFVRFFKKSDPSLQGLQDRVLGFRARVLNLETNETEDIHRSEFIEDRSSWLAQCFIEGRSVLIRSLAKSLLVFIEGRAALSIAGASSDPPSPFSQFRDAGGKGQEQVTWLSKPPLASPEFRKHGKWWTTIYRGVESKLNDQIGFSYIHYLLSHPNQDVSVKALVENFRVKSFAGYDSFPQSTEEMQNEGFQSFDPGIDAIEPDERQRLKNQLSSLDERISYAQGRGDYETVQKLEEDRSAIVADIKKRTDIHGRARKVLSPSERNRKSVQKAIDRALKNVGEHNVTLREHLKRSIKTGTFCRYQPEPHVDWNL